MFQKHKQQAENNKKQHAYCGYRKINVSFQLGTDIFCQTNASLHYTLLSALKLCFVLKLFKPRLTYFIANNYEVKEWFLRQRPQKNHNNCVPVFERIRKDF